MGLQEATQANWGSLELHTYVRGTEPIDGVWFLPELEITLTIQLSFREGGRGSQNSPSRFQQHFSNRQTGVPCGTTPRETIELNQRTVTDQLPCILGKANANASYG